MKIALSLPTRFAVICAVSLAATCAGPGASQAAPDAAKGESLFKAKCSICHQTEAGKHMVGPSLHAVVGRKAGHAEGFKLYRGLKDADWTWDEAALNGYLTDPVTFTKERTGKSPGMVLKTPDQQQRDDIIAFLKTLK